VGVFSWNCKSCERSILNHMIDMDGVYCQATVIFPDGSIIHGSYDGYGRIGGRQLNDCLTGDNGTFYHTSCWRGEGSPLDYAGPSDPAEDQGHFVDLQDYYGCKKCGHTFCKTCDHCGERACECLECPYCGDHADDDEECDFCGRYLTCSCKHGECG